MELPETCGMLGCYIELTPYVKLSNFPLLVLLLCYGTKYNSIRIEPLLLPTTPYLT